eukprot:TRINITY_DN9564_c0_g1_i1.p1 TRINITY_DN9564_c0_g1~~TRINITY_DN9564_c0_g1_i1.p1  ORF type:complete len:54 (-),score=2.35 TRINITY_DN9564_c0_g1_i1:224-385(-)
MCLKSAQYLNFKNIFSSFFTGRFVMSKRFADFKHSAERLNKTAAHAVCLRKEK